MAFLPTTAGSVVIFRAKMRQAPGAAHLLEQSPEQTRTQPWGVHCRHAGAWEKVLGYLARYVFRVATTHSRLESFAEGQVTFRYRDNRTQQLQRVTLAAGEFIGRFMQHILPPGFPKCATTDWPAPANSRREQARTLIKPERTTHTIDAAADLRFPVNQIFFPAAALSTLPNRTSHREANTPPAKEIPP